ncbi:MAG: hypothetical protein ACI4F1_05645, partial [Bariatricus sp.]
VRSLSYFLSSDFPSSYRPPGDQILLRYIIALSPLACQPFYSSSDAHVRMLIRVSFAKHAGAWYDGTRTMKSGGSCAAHNQHFYGPAKLQDEV